ncbi:M1 family peptidase [Paenibacillus sp. N10]|uniref:M1 family peptidase n=2 Tax=Paenibacillus lutrae TaxID=2078573 RepID=A0A7X3FN92_9BACL|nr:M1 family peptidase [Paenibacillus lutrae]
MLVNGVKNMNLKLANRKTAWFATAATLLSAVLLTNLLLSSPEERTGLTSRVLLTDTAPNDAAPAQSEPVPPIMQQPSSSGTVHPQLSKRIVEYHINVEYNPENETLLGQQTMTWKNPGSQPVQELYMHLYPNAFASEKTTFMKESGGKLRGDEAKKGSFGEMELRSIKTGEEIDLSSTMQYVQPDDGNPDDRTLLKVTLPKPVAAGGAVTLHTNFAVKLPQAFARMGVTKDYVMAGQWFPKLAVYEPSGTRGRQAEGWNLHQYHGNSEFYADFGIFDVRIKVPSNYIVAATGFQTKNPIEGNGTKTYQYYADDVHDFAWAASPHFKTYEEPYSAPNLPGVKIKLYLDPKHEPYKARYMIAAKKALSRYSQWYGAYPYSTLSIVVPPEEANGTGGMEYPTLITAWGASEGPPDLELERVVVHEIGHQFWYGLVASNEFEEAWLDEGFTSYTEDKLMELEYGAKPNLPVEASYITSPADLKKNAWAYRDHSEYADNVYTRAKLVLKEIENRVGLNTMDRVMKTYFQKWKFKHPGTRDFQTVLEDVTKSKWNEFFDQYVYGNSMSDYAVDRIHVNQTEKSGQLLYESSILIRKLGGTAPAVPIHFHFSDGSTIEKTWDGQGEQIEYKLTNQTPVNWVSVDPKHSLVLENRHINNYMKAEIDSRWQIRWTLSVVKVLETLFESVAW